jgi:SAM-dependent methyltransferase
MNLTDVERDIAAYFTSVHDEAGSSPLGVGWNGEASQRIRFEQLCKIIDPAEPYSINELGCGYGALHDYLLQIGTSPDYAGYDVSEAMIDGARQHLAGRENVSLECSGKPLRLADYSVASGLFNVRMGRPDDEWLSFIIATLDEMNRNSGKAFSFNALTKYSDPEKMRPDLYYADPLVLFDHCKRHYSRNVALLHDYEIYDFTILVRK